MVLLFLFCPQSLPLGWLSVRQKIDRVGSASKAAVKGDGRALSLGNLWQAAWSLLLTFRPKTLQIMADEHEIIGSASEFIKGKSSLRTVLRLGAVISVSPHPVSQCLASQVVRLQTRRLGTACFCDGMQDVSSRFKTVFRVLYCFFYERTCVLLISDVTEWDCWCWISRPDTIVASRCMELLSDTDKVYNFLLRFQVSLSD